MYDIQACLSKYNRQHARTDMRRQDAVWLMTILVHTTQVLFVSCVQCVSFQ